MENTSDIILSILTTLGTMGSAVAAFYAVKQTIKQRKIAITPQLIINNCQVRSKEINDYSYHSFPISVEYFMQHKPEIINVGSGVALNTTITIEFDFHSKMLFFAENEFKLNGKYNFQFEDLSKSQEYKKKFLLTGMGTSLLKEAETTFSLGYIPPQNNNNNKVSINLSMFYIETLMNELLFLNKLNNKTIDVIEGPSFKLSYNDMDGNEYNIHYKSKLNVYDTKKTTNKIAFAGMLEFEADKQRWTQRRLQRIRKSYADFINEHDYNKNK